MRTKPEVIRRKHIIHLTSSGAYSSTYYNGQTPWESISSDPPSMVWSKTPHDITLHIEIYDILITINTLHWSMLYVDNKMSPTKVGFGINT